MTLDTDVLKEVARALRGLRFGEVVVTVHDGRVVQVTRTERVRLAPEPTDPQAQRSSPGRPKL